MTEQLAKLQTALSRADAVVVGAGAGLSAAAGFAYSGERFLRHFGDFAKKYGFRDMYAGGFYPYSTPEEFWAFWSRDILINRYRNQPKPVYDDLLALLKGKEYFVLTTNVDHCFQKSGFDKARLFYMQGDYGLFQCSKPCHNKTYDNEAIIRQMVSQQKDMKIPTELIPRCPVCGKPLTTNLRVDDKFVQDEGWTAACERYRAFLSAHPRDRVLFLELGVGANTPAVIKYPFWRMTANNPNAAYVCINLGEAFCPPQIEKQSICISADLGETLRLLKEKAAVA